MTRYAPRISEIKNGWTFADSFAAGCSTICSNSETASCYSWLIFMIGSTGKVRPENKQYTVSRSLVKVCFYRLTFD
jgi:hypothetical protein